VAFLSLPLLAFTKDNPALSESAEPHIWGGVGPLTLHNFTLSKAPDASAVHSGPTGFLEIAWGDDTAKAKQVMKERVGVKLLRESADELLYGGGTCAGLPVEVWRLRFVSGKFYQASVSFEFPVTFNDKGSVSDKINDALRGQIVERYGELGFNNSSAEHNQQNWLFPETKESKGEKEITLNYGWSAGVLAVCYTNRYYESLVNPVQATTGDL
jgi:hypothetical protein